MKVNASLFITICGVLCALALAGCGLSSLGGDTMLSGYLKTHQKELGQPISVDTRPRRFVVEPGTPARTIGQNLIKANLIGDDRLFEAYVRVNGLDEKLAAGTFILTPSMTIVDIVDVLQQAKDTSITMTIPEGWRREQIADYLEAAGIFTNTTTAAEDYRRQTATSDLTGLDPSKYPFLQGRPAGVSLEGYLFPDTYQLPPSQATAADVLQRQLDDFAARVVPLYEKAVISHETNLDLYQVLILASIVEREAVVPAERPMIARVYLNRLDQEMRLEADPTVQYAMGYQKETGVWWKTPVSLEEYAAVDSPYNTYLHTGLPPGPIANPGLSSIEAVLKPAQHDYLYFVALPDGSGNHVFAKTFEDQTKNVERYRQGQ
ncbi:endolytic transglycosylase MltG [soil metagenome]